MYYDIIRIRSFKQWYILYIYIYILKRLKLKYLYIFLIDPKMLGKMKLQTIHGDTLRATTVCISGKSTGRWKRWWMWWWQDRDGDQDEGEDDDGDESILSEGETDN